MSRYWSVGECRWVELGRALPDPDEQRAGAVPAALPVQRAGRGTDAAAEVAPAEGSAALT